MDSINLSETQSTPLNWRNTASNTNPISCACCGSKDYTQANYYRSLYPWMPRCQHPQDDSENNDAIPPFFPSFPFLQPFFHNSTMPGYVCCSRYRLDDSVVNLKQTPEQNQSTRKNENKVSHSGDHPHDKKVRHDSIENTPSMNDSARKNVGILGPEPQIPGHPFLFSNLMDPRLNAFQRCACDDSTPWTCSPFIIPIVSYCLFWNSQKHNVFFSNYPDIRSEMKLQPHSAASPRHSNSVNANTPNIKITNEPQLNNSLISKNSTLENCLGVEKLIEEDWKTNEGNSLHSVNSHNFGECHSLIDREKRESTDFNSTWSSICTEKAPEAMDADSFIVENQVESEEFLNMDVKASFHSKSQMMLTLDGDTLKENDSRVQLTPQTKISDGFKSCDEERIDSDEGSSLSLKKSYMNIQDQKRSCIVLEETRGDEVAGGDAGGEHCMGYRVQISPPREHQEANIQEIPTKTDLTVDSRLIKGLVDLKEKKSENLYEKTPITNVKNSRFKAGTIKTVVMTSPRERKPNHESSSEPTVMKRKHACYPSVDNGMGQTENKSKIQKIKNTTNKPQEPGKLQKGFNSKSQYYKRDEKVSTLKITTQAIPMHTSDIAKSRRK